MRVAFALVIAMTLTVLVGEPAMAQQQQQQQQETLWQRFKGVFTRKSNGGAPKAEMRPIGNDAKRTDSTGPHETRGVVYIDELKPTPLPQAPVRPMPANTSAIKQRSAPINTSAIKNTPAVAAPSKAVAPAATKNELLAQGLTRQVTQKCPQARNVKVVFTGDKEVTVEMEVRTQEEANTLVEQVFAIRDLDAYRVNVKFTVPQQ